MVHDLICDVPLSGFLTMAKWYSKAQLYLARLNTEEPVNICSKLSLCWGKKHKIRECGSQAQVKPLVKSLIKFIKSFFPQSDKYLTVQR